MQFESKDDLPSQWAEGLEKVLPKEATSANQERKMFFFVQEKDRPAEFKVIPEPDPKF